MSYKDLEAIGISNNHYNNKNTNKGTANIVANIIKIVSIIGGLICVCCGFSLIDKSDFAIPIIIASIISAIFVFGLGEIIQLLEDIKNK